MYSSPPKHGALIASRILSDKNNFDAWQKELNAVSFKF